MTATTGYIDTLNQRCKRLSEERRVLTAEVAKLRAALVEERATAMYLRDVVEGNDDRGQPWPTQQQIASDLPYARLELQREGLLPPE